MTFPQEPANAGKAETERPSEPKPEMELTMIRKKQTKGTVVFECIEEGAPIRTLYINKQHGFDQADIIDVTVRLVSK